MKKKLFSSVKYDNLTVFDWNLYSGWFDQKVNFWPRKWTLGPKLSKKWIKRIYFLKVKIKSFVSNFFWKPAKYHVSNKRRVLNVFLWLLATVSNFNVNEKKLIKFEKKNFSPAWNMIIWQFLTENYIQGGLTKK
jgi:hypothetical protein